MTLRDKKRLIWSVFIFLPIIIAVNCFLYPSEIRYKSYLLPNISGSDTAYSLEQSTNTVSFDYGGSAITVKYMTEADLNALFPEESSQGYYSTNPYTYGNWINPDLGYTPNRFTVFQVTVINRTFAKLRLSPIEALLITDIGEIMHSYSTSIAAGKYGKSFEEYYKTIRGQSGNEYYRYEMRIGMLHGKNYGLEETIFRGDTYGGLISFDPLKPEVKRVKLIFKNIVYRFDAFNRPADTFDASFNFDRKIEKVEITHEMRMKELAKDKSKIVVSEPTQLVGNRTNDSARNGRSIQRNLEQSMSQMEKCFMDRFRKDEVTPGRLLISFNIEPSGNVSSQNVIETKGISNEDFMNCILGIVKKSKFEQIVDMPLEGSNIVKGPAKKVNVTIPIDFSIVVEEQK